MSEQDDYLLTIPQVLTILSISRGTFYKLVEMGEIKLIKLGEKTNKSPSRVRNSDLQAYIASLEPKQL